MKEVSGRKGEYDIAEPSKERVSRTESFTGEEVGSGVQMEGRAVYPL
jgi:hypothetical protein